MARKHVNFRISQAADDFITKLADEHEAERSVVIRAMLTVATQHTDSVSVRIKHEMESR